MIKYLYLFLALVCINAFAFKSFDDVRVTDNVIVGSLGTPDASSILELRSTTGGLLLPRLTTVERDAIGAPVDGLLIFNTTTKNLDVYDGVSVAWETIPAVPPATVGLQSAYDLSTGFPTPEIVADLTRRAVTIQDAAIPTTFPLLEVQDNGGTNIFFVDVASGMVATIGDIANINFAGNVMSASNANGNVELTANGTGSVVSNNLHDFIAGSQWTQIATPANPPALSNKLYFKADNQLYTLTSGGVEAAVGGGGGFADPMTTRGDVIIRDATNTTARLAVGGAAQVLTSDGTDVSWAANPAGFADPMTTRGDVIIRDATNTTARLAVGGANEVLTSDGTDISWAAGLTDPMTTRGDVIIRDAANATARLAVGANNQVLTSDGTDISWQNAAAGFADPMTTRGDVIIRDAANTTARLAVGGANEALLSDGTDIAWGAVYADPMTTRGDVLIRDAANATNRLAIGGNGTILTSDGTDVSWAANAALTDPMTTRGDVLIRDAANATNRLAIGGNGTYLGSDGTDVSWSTPPDVGFADPMTTRGDVIIRNAANATARLAIGGNGTVLTSDGTDIAWAASAGLAQTSFAGANNQAAATNVTGMTAAGNLASQYIVAVTIDATADFAAICTLNAVDVAGTFVLSTECTGSVPADLEVVFSITAGGQVQYTSGNYAGFVSLDFDWKEIDLI